jgi:hypothetical protein
MPRDVTCPLCQHRFAGPDNAGGFACPRCGAALARTEVWPLHGTAQGAPGPAVLVTTVCPSCGKAVPELCLLCPHCEGPLAERQRTPAEGPGAGQEERRAPSEGRLFLAILGGLGFITVLGLTFEALVRRGAAGLHGVVSFVMASLMAYLLIALCLAVKAAPRREGRWALLLVDVLAGLGCLAVAAAAAGLALAFVWVAAR